MVKSYDEIQELFEKEMKRVNTFMAMSSKAQESNEKKVEEQMEVPRVSSRLGCFKILTEKIGDSLEVSQNKAW
ncbi:hypothetical protein Tco_0866633 [Tanacetum coccineum]